MTKNTPVSSDWTPGTSTPSKKGDYVIRINAPGATPPYVEVEVVWNGKSWREDGQFTVPTDSVVSWKPLE